MAMDAILATIVDREQGIVGINRDASRNKLISFIIFTLKLNPLTAALSNPFRRGSWGWGEFHHRNRCLRGKRLHHGGDVCVLCVLLAKSLPSRSFLFPLERT
jgi:hypothetical protein